MPIQLHAYTVTESSKLINLFHNIHTHYKAQDGKGTNKTENEANSDLFLNKNTSKLNYIQ